MTLAIAWAVVEIGWTVADVLDAVATVLDPCSTTPEKLLTVGGVAAGAVLPGSFGKLGKKAGRSIARRAGRGMGRGGPETFEILDGVRRSKSAEFVGKKTIPAEIIDAKGRNLGVTHLRLESLLSPKTTIDISTPRAADRFFKRNLDPAKAGSIPPPITVTPGTHGTPIRDVVLDPLGSQ